MSRPAFSKLVGREPICGGSRKVFEIWFCLIIEDCKYDCFETFETFIIENHVKDLRTFERGEK
jgi:hypothetical protein